MVQEANLGPRNENRVLQKVMKEDIILFHFELLPVYFGGLAFSLKKKQVVTMNIDFLRLGGVFDFFAPLRTLAT